MTRVDRSQMFIGSVVCCNHHHPPPPSPPPPGRGVDVKFEVGDPMDVVSSYAYDFRIKVKHPSCDDKDDCLAPEDEKHTNQRNGLRCDITVQPEGKTCSTFSKDSLPCRRWRISYPTRRLDSIEMSDKDGKLASGKKSVLLLVGVSPMHQILQLERPTKKSPWQWSKWGSTYHHIFPKQTVFEILDLSESSRFGFFRPYSQIQSLTWMQQVPATERWRRFSNW